MFMIWFALNSSIWVVWSSEVTPWHGHHAIHSSSPYDIHSPCPAGDFHQILLSWFRNKSPIRFPSPYKNNASPLSRVLIIWPFYIFTAFQKETLHRFKYRFILAKEKLHLQSVMPSVAGFVSRRPATVFHAPPRPRPWGRLKQQAGRRRTRVRGGKPLRAAWRFCRMQNGAQRRQIIHPIPPHPFWGG